MAVLVPVRIGRMQAALKAAIAAILGSSPSILWAHAEIPRPTSTTDIVRLQMLSGPSHVGTFMDEAVTADLPTSSTVTISAVTIGRRYWIRLNGYDYGHDAAGVEDKDDVRDALIALINATDAEETATASIGGSGVIALSPDVPGGIQTIEVSPAAQMTIANGGTEFIRLVTGERQSTISIQCFAHSEKLTTSAHSMAAQIKAGLDLETVKALLVEAGVSVMSVGDTVDLTAIAGAHFETRAQFDLTIFQKSVLTEQISSIENVEFTLQGIAETYP